MTRFCEPVPVPGGVAGACAAAGLTASSERSTVTAAAALDRNMRLSLLLVLRRLHVALDDVEDEVIGEEIEPDAHHRERGVRQRNHLLLVFAADVHEQRVAAHCDVELHNLIEILRFPEVEPATVLQQSC